MTVFKSDPYALKQRRKALLLFPVVGPACFLFGYALAWSIGAGEKASNLVAGSVAVAGLFTTMVVIVRQALRSEKK
jgi:hypothetical protein